MAAYAHQHYVPRFLLEGWHTGADSKLTSFRWAQDRLVSHRYRAKSVAKERHLYSMNRSAPAPDVRIEQAFWGPRVDDPAALVHAKLLGVGVNSLDPEDRSVWARFLISLMLRGPTMIGRIRARGREILSAGLDEGPNDFLEMRGDAPEETLRRWIEVHNPDLLDDLGVMTLPQLVSSEKLNPILLRSTWGVRALPSARYDLLMGDRPLFVAGSLGSSFLVTVPLAPTKLFFALNDPGTLRNVQGRKADSFVRACNLSMVDAAHKYVFATDSAQGNFVARHLRRQSPGE